MIHYTPSPNFEARDRSITMLVLHYTGMQSAAEAIVRLCDPAAKVSAHYVVEEDGTIHSLVEEGMRAWHAGVSCWRGIRHVNAASIGIEIVNPGHEFGYRAFPEAQMQALIPLCQGILARHPGIQPRNVVGHSDVAPLRKEDPGELFDWPRLARAGIGLWPEATDETAHAATERMARDLTAYGYEVSAGSADDASLAAIRAFQRHFRPERINGVWDEACAARLDALLRMV